MNGIQWPAVWAIVGKDIRAIRRSKAVVIPMLLVPTLLMIVLPLVIGYAARTASPGEGAGVILDSIPGKLAEPIEALPPEAQLLTLVLGFLLAPLFMIVPLMVSAVIAADAFAGEKGAPWRRCCTCRSLIETSLLRSS